MKMKSSKESIVSNEIFDLIVLGKKNSYEILAGGPRFSKEEGPENLSNEIDLVIRSLCSVMGLQNSGYTRSSASLVNW